jgi:phosphatidate phosphatase PAH1
MKKITLLLAACAFATASFAQTPETEVKVRDNGTKKVVTKTGKTNVGQALENSADAAGNVATKAGRSIKRGAKKASRSVKHNSQKASRKAAKKTAEMDAKSE